MAILDYMVADQKFGPGILTTTIKVFDATGRKRTAFWSSDWTLSREVWLARVGGTVRFRIDDTKIIAWSFATAPPDISRCVNLDAIATAAEVKP